MCLEDSNFLLDMESFGLHLSCMKIQLCMGLDLNYLLHRTNLLHTLLDLNFQEDRMNLLDMLLELYLLQDRRIHLDMIGKLIHLLLHSNY